MSTAEPPSSTTITTTGVGLGYGITIAVSILVLISTIMLVSYLCVRIKSHGRRDSFHLDIHHQPHTTINSGLAQPGPFIMGLEKPMIESYPKMILGESRRLPKPNGGQCAICLTDYLPKETIRCVPDCQHCFHADCVDEWLKMSATCPLCRNSPAPSPITTPVATPLSELAPLAFHAR
ncbi:putative transcription factor C2H2 family [Medicago truncatula]|uniref:Putative transcription factor C2H2 family n=2 Tax=Medicago truncatula TaxID=3880 RepID=A0A072UT50_MEDTR|nr:zinc finger, C3HC4 type (RING finger) protein [Medicago truncatula]RHN65598.1 putative transcription factor C2H2 family [Medicago truncatula]